MRRGPRQRRRVWSSASLGVIVAALALLGAACGSVGADAVVIDSERVTTTERPTTTDAPTTTDGSTTTEDGPTTTTGGGSGATIPGDGFGCPASGDTSLFPCDDADPTDQLWHVGTCLDLDEADNSYGERPCAGATAFVKELATGGPDDCFFTHVATVDLTDDELAGAGPGGAAVPDTSVWCVSDP